MAMPRPSRVDEFAAPCRQRARELNWAYGQRLRCYRFDLSGELLEMHKELVGGDASEHNSPSNNSMCFWRIGSDRFVKSRVCQGDRYIAMDGNDARDLICI
jgi:hypothetical protein